MTGLLRVESSRLEPAGCRTRSGWICQTRDLLPTTRREFELKSRRRRLESTLAKCRFQEAVFREADCQDCRRVVTYERRESLTVNGVPVNLTGDAPVDCDTRQWPNSASNRTMGMGTPSIKSRIERIVSLLKTKLKT
jgi:hypothetical protein